MFDNFKRLSFNQKKQAEQFLDFFTAVGNKLAGQEKEIEDLKKQLEGLNNKLSEIEKLIYKTNV